MSEYQYYEFLAVDRPLTGREMGELRAVGMSGISCAGHDEGKEGTLAWHDAKRR